MTYQSTNKFSPDSRLIFGSLLFITDKFGDLSLQEPEPHPTKRIPLIPVRVSLVTEPQLRHGFNTSGEMEMPSGDKADHNQSPSKSDSDGGREVYMVGQGEPPIEKTIEEIARESEEVITRVARLAEAAVGKRCNDRQDDSGSSQDGAPSRGHHPKYNR
jgi:hypothetical protein